MTSLASQLEAIELAAGMAWLHELRDEDGKWTRTPGDKVGTGLDRYKVPAHERLINPRADHPDPADYPFFRKHPVSADNVIAAYDATPQGLRDAGMHWYHDAYLLARALAHGNAEEGAILLANYSPQANWPINMFRAARVADEGKPIPAGEGYVNNDQVKKAQKALDGMHIDQVLISPKTRSFAHLLANGDDSPDDPYGHVVIDAHALNVAAGGDIRGATYGSNTKRKKLPPEDQPPIGSDVRAHEYVGDMYRQAAKYVSERDGVLISPHQMQAITWVGQVMANQAEDRAAMEQEGSAKGRLAARAKDWKRWLAYAKGHHFALIPGVSALSAQLLAIELASDGSLLAQLLAGPVRTLDDVELAFDPKEPRNPATGEWVRYLRVGDPPAGERSANYVTGDREQGVSVYELHPSGYPLVPASDDEDASASELYARLQSDEPKHLVTGRVVGRGQENEPLLRDVQKGYRYEAPGDLTTINAPGDPHMRFMVLPRKEAAGVRASQQGTITLPDLGHTGRTVTLDLPPVPRGHTRIYRFTNGANPEGPYSYHPLTGFGTQMYYVDVPSDDLASMAAAEAGQKGFYTHSGKGAVAVEPLVHPTARVKKYELTDWSEPTDLATSCPDCGCLTAQLLELAYDPKDERGRPLEAWRDEPRDPHTGEWIKLYHGTAAELQPGDYIEPGHTTNYPGAYDGEEDEALTRVHVTPVIRHAWQHADNAVYERGKAGKTPGRQRVYEVEPTGQVQWGSETFPEDFESDEQMFAEGDRLSTSPFRVVRELPYQGEELPFTKRMAELSHSGLTGQLLDLAAWTHERRVPKGSPGGGEWTRGRWHFDPQDTPQQRRVLRTNKTSQLVRSRFPTGTRVRAKVSGELGTVQRHVPGTDAQGGHLTIKWDRTGVTGRHGAIGIEPAPSKERRVRRHITAAEARGNSRPVSMDEYQHLAALGNRWIDIAKRDASPTTGLDEHWDKIKADAYAEARKPWGGATIDAHTGVPVKHNADVYALSVKPAHMHTISVPETATQDEFNAAMDRARELFRPALERKAFHLGVFHDDENHRIDIDPVAIVDSVDLVEQVGSYTRSIGGAFHFRTGNGVFPPHVREGEVA